MAGQREFRRRIRSVQSTKKITRAMELIAASRIVRAQQRVAASEAYVKAVTGVVGAVAGQSGVEHPLTTPRPERRRAAVLVVTSDRGLAGGYSSNALRAAEQLAVRLGRDGTEVQRYAIGRKAAGYFRFRGRPVADAWSGFSEEPQYADAKRAADAMIRAFTAGSEQPDGVDEIHVVYTRFVSAVTQRPEAVRVLPLADEEMPDADGGQGRDTSGEPGPLYEFEPSATTLLDQLLPRYVESRIYAALLESAASEHAARRRAMKAASDNADELIKSLTRAANAARQAEITQEIMEIVGGAEALSADGRADV